MNPMSFQGSPTQRREGAILVPSPRFGIRLALLVATAFPPALPMWPVLAQAQAIKTVPAPGRVLDIGGYKLHLNCLGSGGPTVVIDAGAGSWSSAWLDVLEMVAAETRVCAYDRAGMGWSETSPHARTAAVMASELHSLLVAAGEPQPYVLVGHSFGGYIVRIRARNAANRGKLVSG